MSPTFTMCSHLGEAYLYVYVYLLPFIPHTLHPYDKTGTKVGSWNCTMNKGVWSLSLEFRAGGRCSAYMYHCQHARCLISWSTSILAKSPCPELQEVDFHILHLLLGCLPHYSFKLPMIQQPKITQHIGGQVLASALCPVSILIAHSDFHAYQLWKSVNTNPGGAYNFYICEKFKTLFRFPNLLFQKLTSEFSHIVGSPIHKEGWSFSVLW